MEKNRIRPVKAGKGMRMSYSRQKEVLEMPNLIEVQKDSYQWFLKEGLKEVFDDISPIADYSGHLSLEFVDFTLCESDVKYTIPECKERDATYAAPLKVKVRLHNKETDEINEHEIFMGDLPLMTETGTFVINGAERVIVSQLVRSPGIYYGIAHDKVGKKLYSCTVIPNRGAWLEYETDSNDVFYVRVDRTRKVPITVLIRALGIGTNQEIVDLFGEEPKILASFGKDVATNYEEGLLELYKKIRPGEPLTVESAESLISAMFFDPRRYDLAKVGRYKFNKKLMLKNRINGHVLAEDVVNLATGEIIAEAGTEVTRSLADDIQNAAVPYVWIQTETRNVKVLSSMMVDLRAYVDCNPKDLGITELVYYPVLAQLMEEHTDIDDLIIDTDKSTVYFKDSKLKLDVGAIAKGFVCNKIYQFITDNDLWQGAVISLGGNIITVGNKPDNTNFIIGIENPNSSEYLDKVIADDKTSVVTSGSYQRYYTVGGKKYCHIIDKNTLFPADYFTSVTVICNNSALADAYSTALFCMNLSDGLQFAKDNDIEVIWMDNSGKITKTSGVNSAK